MTRTYPGAALKSHGLRSNIQRIIVQLQVTRISFSNNSYGSWYIQHRTRVVDASLSAMGTARSVDARCTWRCTACAVVGPGTRAALRPTSDPTPVIFYCILPIPSAADTFAELEPDLNNTGSFDAENIACMQWPPRRPDSRRSDSRDQRPNSPDASHHMHHLNATSTSAQRHASSLGHTARAGGISRAADTSIGGSSFAPALISCLSHGVMPSRQ